MDFTGLPDTEAIINKLRIEGAGLEPQEIFAIFALLDRAADAKSLLSAAGELSRQSDTLRGDVNHFLATVRAA